MDMSKKYRDIKNNERNILEMLKLYPEWAANRLQLGEKAIDVIKRIRVILERNDIDLQKLLLDLREVAKEKIL